MVICRIVIFFGLTGSGASVGRWVCGLDSVRARVGGRVACAGVRVVRTRLRGAVLGFT